jgi:hypothetical protein
MKLVAYSSLSRNLTVLLGKMHLGSHKLVRSTRNLTVAFHMKWPRSTEGKNHLVHTHLDHKHSVDHKHPDLHKVPPDTESLVGMELVHHMLGVEHNPAGLQFEEHCRGDPIHMRTEDIELVSDQLSMPDNWDR